MSQLGIVHTNRNQITPCLLILSGSCPESPFANLAFSPVLFSPMGVAKDRFLQGENDGIDIPKDVPSRYLIPNTNSDEKDILCNHW